MLAMTYHLLVGQSWRQSEFLVVAGFVEQSENSMQPHAIGLGQEEAA